MSADDDRPEVLFRAKLQRDAGDVPWGFRLQGGVEFDTPLTLLKVMPDSVAARYGLQAGDIVVRLSGHSADAMTHLMAQQAIASSGNTLEIIVERAEVTLPTQTANMADSNHVIMDNNKSTDNGLGQKTNRKPDLQVNNIDGLKSSADSPHVMQPVPQQNRVVGNADVISENGCGTTGRRDDLDPVGHVTRPPTSNAELNAAPSSTSTTSTTPVVGDGPSQVAHARPSASSAPNPPGETSAESGSRQRRRSDDGPAGGGVGGSPDENGSRTDNIPQSSPSDVRFEHLHPVEALVKTDILSRDYQPSTSSDAASDTTDDLASEISDDTSSVIDLDMAADAEKRDDDDDDFRKVVAAAAPSADRPPVGNSVDPVASGRAETKPEAIVAAVDDAPVIVATSPTTAQTPTGSQPVAATKTRRAAAAAAAPTAAESSTFAVESVVSSHVSVNFREPPTPPTSATSSSSSSSSTTSSSSSGTERRDFSQTAPWRVNRSLSASVGSSSMSYSDPDISASSSVAAASDVPHHRFVPERVGRSAREAAAPPPTTVATGVAPERIRQRGGQVAVERASTEVPETAPSTPRRRATQASTDDAPTSGMASSTSSSSSSSAAAASTPEGGKSTSGGATGVQTPASSATATSTPRTCYIPQRPPPLPLPDNELVKPLRSVKVAKTDPNATASTTNATTTTLPTPALRHVELPGKNPPPSAAVALRRTVSVDDADPDATPGRTGTSGCAPVLADLIDLPLPPVREMVADLNSRLERVEQSASESPTWSPLGSRYDVREATEMRRHSRRRRSSSGSDSEREIIINTPPAAFDAGDDESIRGWTERLLSPPSRPPGQRNIITPTVSYHGTIIYSAELQPPLSPRSARRYSLPTGSLSPSTAGGGGGTSPRRVRFADPPESSVVEIESRRLRRRDPAAEADRLAVAAAPGERVRRSRRIVWAAAPEVDEDEWRASMSSPTDADMDYSSASSLSEKLDRIELENALASAAMKRSRPFQQQQQAQPPQQQQRVAERCNVGPPQWTASFLDPQSAHRSATLPRTNPVQQQVIYGRSPVATLEPIQERVVPIRMPSAASPSFDDADRRYFQRRGSAAAAVVVGPTPPSGPADPSSGRPGGFSVSIGPGSSTRFSVSVRQQPGGVGPQFSVVIPSKDDAGAPGRFTYSISTGPAAAASASGRRPAEQQPPQPQQQQQQPAGSIHYSLPPSYEESLRARVHTRTPSLQESGVQPDRPRRHRIAALRSAGRRDFACGDGRRRRRPVYGLPVAGVVVGRQAGRSAVPSRAGARPAGFRRSAAVRVAEPDVRPQLVAVDPGADGTRFRSDTDHTSFRWAVFHPDCISDARQDVVDARFIIVGLSCSSSVSADDVIGCVRGSRCGGVFCVAFGVNRHEHVRYTRLPRQTLHGQSPLLAKPETGRTSRKRNLQVGPRNGRRTATSRSPVIR